MLKASLLLMAVLTVLAAMGLRWREQRGAPAPRLGWVEKQKKMANRWVTAAAIASIGTMLLLGGLQWLRVWQG
jgi:hypothetical protein